MNWEAIGAVGEVGGAVAVVVTFVYLATQIRQSTDWNKRQGFRDGLEMLINWTQRVSDSSELAEFYGEGRERYSEFDERQALRFYYLQVHRYASWELMLDFHRIRAIKLETINAIDRLVREDFTHAGVRAWWGDQGRESFADDFSDWVDGVIAADDRA